MAYDIRTWMLVVENRKLSLRSPTGKFLRAMDKFRTDPAKPMFGTGREYMLPNVKCDLRPLNDTEVVLQSLMTIAPRAGHGTRALTTLCHFADKFRVVLRLDASPYSTNYMDMTIPRDTLKAWYARFGFTPVAYHELRRDPQG
jgi:hypothetical protein